MSDLQINSLAKSQLIAENGGLKEIFTSPKEFMILPKNPVVGKDGRKFNYNAQDLIKAFQENKVDIPVDINLEGFM